MPCASRSPGAAASMNAAPLTPARRTTTTPAIVPKRIPPQMPSPPFHTSKTPCHFGPGTWSHDVRPCRELLSSVGVVAGPLESLGAPALDPLSLSVYRL